MDIQLLQSNLLRSSPFSNIPEWHLGRYQVAKRVGLFLEILFYSTGLFIYPCANTTILVTVALY